MSNTYGIPVPGAHSGAALRSPARYLVIIQTSGGALARLFLATREPAGEFDAAVEEVVLMTKGLAPSGSAAGPEWDRPLAGHSKAERATAQVFTLDV